jgi:glycosyltransferase involved in cell wall biosynthesis
MRNQPERVSCLMVTRPCAERFELFRRSVACFLAQTYPDRELVVVLDEGPAEWAERFKAHLASLPAAAVVVEPAGKRTLGALRNLSAAAASGEVLCQWDDDDLSHPTRLARQHDVLRAEGALAVGLQEFMHLFQASREMFWENFLLSPDGCHAGTVMFRRGAAARCPEEGPASCKGEDSAFLAGLRSEGKVVPLAGAAYLYVYVYHDNNTFAEDHHRAITLLSLSRGLLVRRRAVLLQELGCLDLGEHPIRVMGYNGLAFEIPGKGAAPGPGCEGAG